MGYSEGTYGKLSVFEDFLGAVDNSAMATVRDMIGGNGVMYSCVGEGTFAQTVDEVGGVLQIVNDTSDNDNVFLHIGPFMPVKGGCRMEARFKMSVPASESAFIGFAETSAIDATTPSMPCELSTVTLAPHSAAGFAGILYDADATTDNFYAVAGDAGTANTTATTSGINSAIAPVSDAWDIVRVEVDETGKAIVQLAEHTGSLKTVKEIPAAVNPSDLFFAVIGFESRAALSTADHFEVDYFAAQGFRDWETS